MRIADIGAMSRSAFAASLREQGGLPSEVLNDPRSISKALRHWEQFHIELTLAEYLNKRGQIPSVILDAMMTDSRAPVRASALQVLGTVDNLDDNVVSSAEGCFRDTMGEMLPIELQAVFRCLLVSLQSCRQSQKGAER